MSDQRPLLKTFTEILNETLESIGGFSLIEEAPRSVEDYDRGMSDADRLAQLAATLFTVATRVRDERETYRSDFLERLAERAQRESDLFMSPGHRFDGNPR